MHPDSKLEYLDFEELSKDFVPDKNPGGSQNLDEYFCALVELEKLRPPVIEDFSRWFKLKDPVTRKVVIDQVSGEPKQVEVFYSGVPTMERIIGHEMDNLWFYPRKPGQEGLGVP